VRQPEKEKEIWEHPPVVAVQKMEEFEGIFDVALETIIHLIHTDVFPRFVKSSAYRKLKGGAGISGGFLASLRRGPQAVA
jgi:hypothetical protein